MALENRSFLSRWLPPELLCALLILPFGALATISVSRELGMSRQTPADVGRSNFARRDKREPVVGMNIMPTRGDALAARSVN